MNRIDRRKFSKLALGGVALFHLRKAGAAPSERIRHASFGASGMAWADIQNFSRHPKFELAAVAEVDDRRVGRVRERFPNAKIYRDWRELLEKEGKGLDSVNVSTPDHMHAPIGATAMRMGLAVYGQKPLAQTLYETRRMAEIAAKTGVVTQMGIQLASGVPERMTAGMVRSGMIGKVKEIFVFSNKTWGDSSPRPDRTDPIPPELDWNFWCGAGPLTPYIEGYCHPGEWRKRLDYGTGTLGDMGCHLYSPSAAALGLSAPLSVRSSGGKPNRWNWAVDERLEYVFPANELVDGKTLRLTWSDGSLRPPARIVEMVGGTLPDQGNVFVGTDGVLLMPHGATPSIYDKGLRRTGFRYPKISPRDHWGDFLDAVAGKKVEPLADFGRYAGPLTESVLLGALASHFPKVELEWDAKGLRTNLAEANRLIRKTYRKGWEIEGL